MVIRNTPFNHAKKFFCVTRFSRKRKSGFYSDFCLIFVIDIV